MVQSSRIGRYRLEVECAERWAKEMTTMDLLRLCLSLRLLQDKSTACLASTALGKEKTIAQGHLLIWYMQVW